MAAINALNHGDFTIRCGTQSYAAEAIGQWPVHF